MGGIWYATREQVKTALDVAETARSNDQIDSVIETASRNAEGFLHRKFYPLLATKYFDYPSRPRSYSDPWVLWLEQHEVISVSSFVSGGVTIPSTDYFLEPVNDGPPYNRIEIDLASSSAFSSGSTHQRSTEISGLWGHSDDSSPAGALESAVASTSTTTVEVTNSAVFGVGSVGKCDSERFVVSARNQLSTGQTLSGSLTAAVNDVLLTVASGAAFNVGEVITLDAEKMLIVEITGNVLTVKRQWDGSLLSTHSNGTTIYAPRSLTVVRGSLGTTPATHLDAASLTVWVPPGPLNELVVAESITMLEQRRAAYARTISSGDMVREVFGKGLEDIRNSAMRTLGRQMRMGAI